MNVISLFGGRPNIDIAEMVVGATTAIIILGL